MSAAAAEGYFKHNVGAEEPRRLHHGHDTEPAHVCFADVP